MRDSSILLGFGDVVLRLVENVITVRDQGVGADLSEGVGKPTWGTKVSLWSIIASFTDEGRYDVGPGWIVVPKGIDFVLEANSPAKGDEWRRLLITQGRPYFEGDGLVKLIDVIGGRAKVHSIDIHYLCRKAEVNIEGWPDWPIEITR